MNLTSKKKGVTLIELLIALGISSILIAALYRTFIGQQKIYGVQEQVVDMQQNARVAINKMMREIRMAGFGNVYDILPLQAIDGPFNNIIIPGDGSNHINQNDDQIIIIGAFEQVSTLKTTGINTIELFGNASEFNTGNRRYICIGGLETNIVTNVDSDKNIITLNSNLKNTYNTGTPIFKVKAITYGLRWDNRKPNMPVLTREDNTNGGGSQVLAENIENLQFKYFLTSSKDEIGSDSPVDPKAIQRIRVTVTARTNMSDPEYKSDGGYRKREIASNIQIRNPLSP